MFLGFSFSDPNLTYMLGHLRSILGDDKPEHFAIMRRARLNKRIKNKHEAQRLYEYDINKQTLQIEDLRRYSIQTLLVEDFDEVTGILESIEEHFYQRYIFVSGSAHQFGDFKETKMRDLCVGLGERLIENNYKLVSGFGLNIGSSVVQGALLKLHEKGASAIEKQLILRPFPRNLPAKVSETTFNRKYRENIIAKCGFAIFIAGTSRTHLESEGVLQEYEIAIELKKIPIPIGATGYAARRIWQMMEPHVERFYRGAVKPSTFRQLNDPSLSNDKLLNVVFDIIQKVSDVAPPKNHLQPTAR